MDLLSQLLLLSSLSSFELCCSFIFVAMTHLNDWQFRSRLDFPGVWYRLLIIDYPVFQVFDVHFSRIVGVPRFWDDDSWYLCRLVLVFAIEWSWPRIVDFVKTQVPNNPIVIFGFSKRLYFVFEAVRVQRWPDIIIIVNNFKFSSKFLSDFSIMLTPSSFQELGDIDIFSPFLFILLAFKPLDFDQVSHFNFGL